MNTYNANCGTPGCASGWIGYFAGFRKPREEGNTEEICRAILHIDVPLRPSQHSALAEFIARMNGLAGTDWSYSHRECARILRLYAAKYHSKEAPARRTDSELVADLVRKLSTERIPEEA